MRHLYLLVLLAGLAIMILPYGITGTPVVYSATWSVSGSVPLFTFAPLSPVTDVAAPLPLPSVEVSAATESAVSSSHQVTTTGSVGTVPSVPFYSQFTDITSPAWKKVGCGISSIAMIIDYYSDELVTVDELLDRGIKSGAYIESAGWSHAGLVALAKPYGITGESHDLGAFGEDKAFLKLAEVLKDGPVIASVYYTFDPQNPIPHLVVVSGVADGRVYFNDPAAKRGGESLTIEAFKRGWKERYISIEHIG